MMMAELCLFVCVCVCVSKSTLFTYIQLKISSEAQL